MAYELTSRRLAMLATINWCEGSPAYNQAFNYVEFNNYGPHPNLKIPFGNTYSTAAGAYQFLYSTWQAGIKFLGIPDFMSPENQDQVGIYCYAQKRKALQYVDSGDLDNAIQILSWEWASMPVVFSETVGGKFYEAGEGRYGQGSKSLSAIKDYYNGALAFYNGGVETLNPVAYNEAVKKKSLLKRVLPSRSSFSFLRPSSFLFGSKKINK